MVAVINLPLLSTAILSSIGKSRFSLHDSTIRCHCISIILLLSLELTYDEMKAIIQNGDTFMHCGRRHEGCHSGLQSVKHLLDSQELRLAR